MEMNTSFNSEKLINHIRKRIDENDPNFEDVYKVSDDAIERIMATTFTFIREKINRCFYCKHFKRRGFSQCRISQHLMPNCFYHDFDRYRMVKKNRLKILILSEESAMAEGKRIDFLIPADVGKKIIYESIRLFELVEMENMLKEVIK